MSDTSRSCSCGSGKAPYVCPCGSVNPDHDVTNCTLTGLPSGYDPETMFESGYCERCGTRGEPPQGVRLVLADGTEVPCQVTHLGGREWEIVMPEGFVEDATITQVRIAVLPGRTSLRLPTGLVAR
jgi:hypothetical protein